MQYRINLVQVNDVIGTNVVLPLAIGILWQSCLQSETVKANWHLGKIVYKKSADFEKQAQELANGDVVCFSNYMWNSEYHLELAARIKHYNPNIFVLVGGPDVSPNNTNFWKKYNKVVDLAIVGEGENSLSKLLEIFPDSNYKNIPGAWTSDFFNGETKRITQFIYENSPYLNGFYDDIVKNEIANGMSIQAVIQTNRGCPYRCTFCEEGREYKNKMFFYNKDRIRDELVWCAKNKVEYLSIADDNWGITQQDIEYFRLIRDLKLEYGYPQVLDATFAKNAPERLLQLADIDSEQNTQLIRGFTVALQSLNMVTLESIKRFNLVPDKQKVLIDGLKQRQMPTYTEIIWPLPYETYETFSEGLDHVIELGLDNWMGVYPLTLQEGTELYEDFINDYTFVKQQSHNDNKQKQKYLTKNNTVNYSTWADTQTLIRGQILYTWLVTLFFFGFARPVIRKLCDTRNTSVCTIVQEFISWIEDNPKTELHKYNNKITQWWSEWYKGNEVPNISLFPNEDTSNWSTYGHLSSFIQNNYKRFCIELEQFVNTQPVWVDRQVLTENSHAIVRYNKIYPYYSDGIWVDSKTEIPKFKSLYEFSRYFYWWKRKNGWHRTDISTERARTNTYILPVTMPGIGKARNNQ